MQGPRRPAARHGAGRLLERRPHPDRDHKLAVSISLNSETLNIANGVVPSTVVCWFSLRSFRIENQGRQKKKLNGLVQRLYILGFLGSVL